MAKQNAEQVNNSNEAEMYQNVYNQMLSHNRSVGGGFNTMFGGPYAPLSQQQQFPNMNQFGNTMPQRVTCPMSSSTNNVFDNTFMTQKGTKIFDIMKSFPSIMSPVSLRMKLLLISRTGNPVFGLTSSGNMIQIYPSQIQPNEMMPEEGLYFGIDSNGSVADLSVKRYPLPEEMKFTMIHELGMVVFHSKEMMEATIQSFGEKHQPGEVASTLLSDIDLIHSGFYGSVKILTSHKNEYYTGVGESVLRIPRVSQKHKGDILSTFGITQESMKEFDYIVIENTLNSGSFDNSYKKSKIYKVSIAEYKNSDKLSKASLMLKTGIVIFPRKSMARAYVNEYRANTREYIIKNSNNMINDFYKKEAKKARKHHRKELFAVKEMLISLVTVSTVGYVVEVVTTKLKNAAEKDKPENGGTIGMESQRFTSDFFEYKREYSGNGAFSSFANSFSGVIGLVLGFLTVKWLVEHREVIFAKIKEKFNKVKAKVKGFFGKIRDFFSFKVKATNTVAPA